VKFTDLRGILQYVPRFREKVFVISVDGAIVTDENFANILLDVAVLRSLNIRVVIVHGGPQIRPRRPGQTTPSTEGTASRTPKHCSL
jgi:amino-acid N-acetyltransferase